MPKTEVVWKPKPDSKPSDMLRKQRGKPEGTPPPKRSITDLP